MATAGPGAADAGVQRGVTAYQQMYDTSSNGFPFGLSPGARWRVRPEPGAMKRRRFAKCRTFLAIAGPLVSATLLVHGSPGSAHADDSPFWVDPDSRAARQVVAWAKVGRWAEAALLRRIARQPTATWLTGDDPGPLVRRITEAAAARGRIPVLVAYNIPHRDCGLYSSGGAANADAYRTWIARLAAGVGDRRALIVLEPDAVAHLATGCESAYADRETDRLQLLKDAVRRLKALPGTRVYLDAGNPGWIPDPNYVAGALRVAGVAEADGFALNVSNFHTTQQNETYGDRLSAVLGGAHYVIDTSRNGKGPWPSPLRNEESWCNPPGRALGTPPTTRTGNPRADAYLWVKRPGESDGSCRGAPPAGEWWAGYALDLAARALT
jgi:endoglucanase